MVDYANHIWNISNLQRDFIVWWLIVPTIFGMSVIYNAIFPYVLLIFARLIIYFHIVLYMRYSMKYPLVWGSPQQALLNIFRWWKYCGSCIGYFGTVSTSFSSSWTTPELWSKSVFWQRDLFDMECIKTTYSSGIWDLLQFINTSVCWWTGKCFTVYIYYYCIPSFSMVEYFYDLDWFHDSS